MAITRLQSTRDFLRIWFTWKKQAFLTFFLIVTIIMSFSYLYSPVYKSKAKIVLLPRTSEGVLVSARAEEDRVTAVSTEDINTAIQLLTSDYVIEETVKSFSESGGTGLRAPIVHKHEALMSTINAGLKNFLIFAGLKESLTPYDANVEMLRKSLEATPVPMSNVILISLKAEVPEAAKNALNRLLSIYIQHHNDTFIKEEGVQFFDTQKNINRDKLEKMEIELAEFKKQWNLIDLEKQKETTIALLGDLRKNLEEVKIAGEEIQARIALVKPSLELDPKSFVITREMRTSPTIVELEKSIIPLIVEQNNILKTFMEGGREHRDITVQINALRTEMLNEVQRALQTDELELKAIKARQNSIQEKISELEKEASSLSEAEKTLARLQREAELSRTNYTLYATKFEDARINMERKRMQLSNVSIISHASNPLKMEFPNRFLMLLLSVFAGFFAAASIPFIIEFLDHRISTPHEVEDLLSLPVICSFPEKKTINQ